MSANDAGWAVAACPTPVQTVAWGHVRYARCMKRSCASCGHLWLGDTRVKVIAAASKLSGAVALVTVTGPGQDVIPWGPERGKADPEAARRWNELAPWNWSRLHKAAQARAARARGRAGRPVDLLIKVWEYQKRGVLHLHLVVPAGTGEEVKNAEAYVTALHELSSAYGFGFVDRGKLPKSGPRQSARRLAPVAPWRAAAYVAGYVVSTGAGKPGVMEVAQRQGVPGAVVYVSPTLTKQSGVTIRSLRARRRIATMFPGADQSADTWRAACLVDALSRRRAPFTPEARRTLFQAAYRHRWTDVWDLTAERWISPTRAASPSAVSEQLTRTPSVRRTGRCRLDLVLHDDHGGDQPCRFWTGPGSFPGVLGTVSKAGAI